MFIKRLEIPNTTQKNHMLNIHLFLFYLSQNNDISKYDESQKVTFYKTMLVYISLSLQRKKIERTVEKVIDFKFFLVHSSFYPAVVLSGTCEDT